jgi:hypothetical protein
VNSRDLRKYAAQTNVRLAVGGMLLLLVVGVGLIYLIWGFGPAMMGLLCLGMGLIPLILIFVALWVMDWVVKRANRE